MEDEQSNPDKQTGFHAGSNAGLPPVDVQPKKKSKKPLIVLAIALVSLVLGGSMLLLKNRSDQTNRSANNQGAGEQKAAENAAVPLKEVEQVFVGPVDGTRTPISKTDYYAVTVRNSQYYGMVSKINDDFIRLVPTAYKRSGVLVLTGKELHGPEAATYFKVSQVTKLQKVDANQENAAITNALKSANAEVSDASPSSEINRYIRQGQFQAYFFADGSAFFAKTASLDGNFLATASRVYVLRAENGNSPAGSGTQLSLVVAKPEQYNSRNTATLQYWQNMRADSQIAAAATEYEKSQ